MKYVALLRGINVGGKNRVPMAELRNCLTATGLTNVSSYINSGNVLFETNIRDTVTLVDLCETAVRSRFGFSVRISVISHTDLKKALSDTPSWWNRGEDVKHNALFVIAPTTTQQVMETVGEPKLEYEKVASSGPIIFWSAPLKTFGRTRWSKIVGSAAYQNVTIRNANTSLKLIELLQK